MWAGSVSARSFGTSGSAKWSSTEEQEDWKIFFTSRLFSPSSPATLWCHPTSFWQSNLRGHVSLSVMSHQPQPENNICATRLLPDHLLQIKRTDGTGLKHVVPCPVSDSKVLFPRGQFNWFWCSELLNTWEVTALKKLESGLSQTTGWRWLQKCKLHFSRTWKQDVVLIQVRTANSTQLRHVGRRTWAPWQKQYQWQYLWLYLNPSCPIVTNKSQTTSKYRVKKKLKKKNSPNDSSFQCQTQGTLTSKSLTKNISGINGQPGLCISTNFFCYANDCVKCSLRNTWYTWLSWWEPLSCV